MVPILFNNCMDWILWWMAERSSCGALLGNVKISDLDFADDAVIFVETLDTLIATLQAVNEESEAQGLWVFGVKTMIQAFNDILGAAILSVPVCGEDVEVTERFTYLGSDMSLLAVSQRSIDIWVRPGKSQIHWFIGCDAAGTCAGRRKSESS